MNSGQHSVDCFHSYSLATAPLENRPKLQIRVKGSSAPLINMEVKSEFRNILLNTSYAPAFSAILLQQNKPKDAKSKRIWDGKEPGLKFKGSREPLSTKPYDGILAALRINSAADMSTQSKVDAWVLFAENMPRS